MEIGVRHYGKVLRGTLIERPLMMFSAMTILEDDDGTAVNLSVYNCVEHTARLSADLAATAARFPRGTRVAVKEPYLKLGKDGLRIHVRVDHPEDVVDLGVAPPAAGPGRQGPGEAAGPAARIEDLRREGNLHFRAQQWHQAIQLYSRCIDDIEAGIAGALFDDAAAVVAQLQRTLAYSNRAEVWLRLRNYEDALRDASKALELDGGHVKSLGRKAKALCGLFCYREAFFLLQETMMDDRRASLSAAFRSELETLQREAFQGEQQKRMGLYALDAYYLALAKGETAGAPRCSDYVGPVEIRKVDTGGGGSGRGLFALTRITAGDLVLVSNPLAVARANDRVLPGSSVEDRSSGYRTLSGSVKQDLITELLEVARRSPRSLRQLYSLSDSTPESTSQVPPMDLFKPFSDSSQVAGTASVGEMGQLEIARVKRIVNVNAFRGPMGLGGLRTAFPDQAAPSGLWGLPSFINHSCLPNCTWGFVGNAMFVRAFREIPPGEEVTIVYIYIHQPLQARSRLLSQQSGFRCCCRRCSFERDIAQRFPVLNRMYKIFANLPPRDGTQLVRLSNAGLKIAGDLENHVLRQLPPDDESKKDWIRASFARAYMCLHYTARASMSSHMRYLRQTLEPEYWQFWTEIMTSHLQMMSSILPTEEVLSQTTGVMNHTLPFPWRWMKWWTKLSVNVCTSLYGPALARGTVEALIESSSSVQVPL